MNGIGELDGWMLLREIGRGAYGVVYLAEGPDGRRAAVKACRRDATAPADRDDERYERELRGAKLYCGIPPQKGLVRVLEVVERPWGFYSVMDLADDEFDRERPGPETYRPKTLADVIQGEKALGFKECVELAISLASGLVALQRHHLLHRDIKPANVLYVGGHPVLSDPGLVVEESVSVSTVGTPGYLPPERKFTDATGDIYSLGLTLKAASFGRKIEEIDKGPALEADTGAPLFPAWWKILNKATDPTPSRRYQSAKALLKDLQSLRMRMAVSSVLRSWMFYAAVGMLVSSAGVYVYIDSLEKSRLADEFKKASSERSRLVRELDSASTEIKKLESEMAPLKEFKKGIEESIEQSTREAKVSFAKTKESINDLLSELGASIEEVNAERKRMDRDSFWWSDSRAINSYTDGVSDNLRSENKIALAIAEIREVDKDDADKLQSSLDKFSAIAAREEAYDTVIDILCDSAKAKRKSGLDDEEEYQHAKILVEERRELHGELRKTLAGLDADKSNMLERINRDWFWCLHNGRICRLDSEAIRDCARRSIAVAEVSLATMTDYIKSLREHFDSFVRAEEIHALARQEFARLTKRADEKSNNGLDDSAELFEMRKRFFARNFYYEHLVNAMTLSWMLNNSSSYVKFDYRYYDDRIFCLRLESYMDLFRREITIIAEEHKILGMQLRSDFEKLSELITKEAAFQRDIDVLHQRAIEKSQKGIDDEEEFLQARKIADKVTTLHKKVLEPLADSLYGRMMDYDHKKSRWDDLYDCRKYSWNVELIRRGIAEVSKFSKEIAAMLQTELDGLVAGNANVAPLQSEIDLLRKKAKEKLRKGQDDSEEYRKAKEIHEKEWEFYNRELNRKVELDSLNDLVFAVWHRSVTQDGWADKSRNGLWRIEERKRRRGK